MTTTLTRDEIEQAQHKALFDLIQNKKDWRLEIDCIIPQRYFEKFDRAAAYFHGRGLTVVDQDEKNFHCKSIGYSCW